MGLHSHFEQIDLKDLLNSEPYRVRPGNSKNNGNGQNRNAALKTLILVVDHERVIADTLVAILRAKNFSAFAAYDGKQGKEAARVLRPGVIISDVLMPGINGLEMTKGIREFLPDVKVFLISRQGSVLTLIDSGPTPKDFVVLPKPIHPDQLLRVLEEHLQK